MRLAWSKRSRTLEAPTPTNISTNSLPLIEKKGTPASPAIARASSVFPVPGGPINNTPLGMRAPRLWNFSRDLRKSTTSRNSCLASSTPATSSKVTVGLLAGNSRARLRPKLKAWLLAPRARVKRKKSKPPNRRRGKKPINKLPQLKPLGLISISTPSRLSPGISNILVSPLKLSSSVPSVVVMSSVSPATTIFSISPACDIAIASPRLISAGFVEVVKRREKRTIPASSITMYIRLLRFQLSFILHLGYWLS